MIDMQGMLVKPWDVAVSGYGTSTYYGTSRGKVIADAWRCDSFMHLTFKEFLRVVRCIRAEPSERFGERFTISGRKARYISHNRQYVQFVWDGQDTVLNTHPLDIDQNEARRGTPYYEEEKVMDDKYWREGTRIIEDFRNEAIAAVNSDDWFTHCPIGMTPERCKGYLGGKIDALQHALEMMGHPGEQGQ